VTVTGENGCTATASETVTLDDTLPTAAITNEGLDLSCNITSLTLTASGGVSYSWTNGSTEVGTSAALEVSEAGTYTVTVTGENGCTATASETVTLDDTLPTAAIANDGLELSCNITALTLTASGGVSYSWSNGSTEVGTEVALEVAEAGTYTVTVTGENGCTATASETVTLDDTLPTAAIANEGLELSCNITSLTLTASDGVSYSWSNGSTEVGTSAALEVTEAGTYTVTVTGENGCTATASETVTLDDTLPTAAIANEGLDLSCNITALTLTASGGVSYSWSNGSTEVGTEASLEVSEAGTYTVTVTGENGCTATASETVNFIPDTEAPVADATELPTITGECSATVSVVPTATDNCGGTIEGTTEDALTYTEQGTFTVTWTFNDGNGNTSTQTQTVIVDDVTAPVADVAELPTVTGECSATVAAVPTATDNCGGTINGITEDALTYTEQGTYTVIWTFDDANGNITTQEQTVIVDDVTAPVADVTELPTVTGECSATVSGVPTATDNCGGTIEGTTEDELTYTEQGTYTLTWTFDDANGNTSTQTQTVIVEDVTAPVADIDELPTVTGECSATVSVVPTATDNCGGTINGTTEDALTYTEQGTYTVTWTFNDGNDNITTQEQTVIVDDVTAPVADVAELPNVTGECSATVSVVPTATDNCGGTINGTTEDALTYTEQGTYTVTWTFNDGNGNITIQEQTVIVDDVTAPVADLAELPTVTGECSATVSVVPTATDNCGGTINATTEDALTYTEQGTYTVTWTFNDGNGNITTQEQTVIVDDVTAPVADVAELPTVTGECSATVSVVPTATDNCGGTINGTTEDALTYTEQGTYTVTWTFDDGNGNITTQEQTVIVDDVTAPVADVAELPTVTGECSATVSVVPTATDNCGGTINGTTEDALTYTGQGTYTVTWTFDDGNGNISTQTQTVIVIEIDAPVVASVTQPTCDIETGSFSITAVEDLEYSLNGGAYTSTTIFEGLSAGTYTVTARTAQGCVTEGVSVTINAQPATPAAPVISSVNQPGCGVATGSFSVQVVNGLEYSIDGETYTTSGSFEGLEPGIYFVVAMNDAGCMSALTEVEITESSTLPSPEIVEIVQPTCEVATGSFTIAAEDGVSYSINGTDYLAEAEFTELAPGTYSLTARNEEGCLSQPLEVTINEVQGAVEIETTTADLCTEDATFDLFELLVGDYDNTGSWSDPNQTGALTGSRIDPALLPVGNYTFSYNLGGDCPTTTTVAVSINDDCVVLPCGFEDIKDSISKAVTPNGDGHNDFFTVNLDTDCGFTYNVKIFNRWGSEVYAATNYQNNWDGNSDRSVTSSTQLPSGTYFYILEINGSGFEPIQGYIYLGTK
jgi:large repetitive protein